MNLVEQGELLLQITKESREHNPMNPEVSRALELARQRYGKNLQGAMPPSQLTPELARKLQAQMIERLGNLGHKVHPRTAYVSGKENKRLGMMRVSPYYEAPKSDHFWFAGYDGKTMQEAIESQ